MAPARTEPENRESEKPAAANLRGASCFGKAREERAQLDFPVRHSTPKARLILSWLMTGRRGLAAGSGYWSEVIGFTLAQPTLNGEW